MTNQPKLPANCPCCGQQTQTYKCAEGAISRWNTRHNDEALRRLVEDAEQTFAAYGFERTKQALAPFAHLLTTEFKPGDVVDTEHERSRKRFGEKP